VFRKLRAVGRDRFAVCALPFGEALEPRLRLHEVGPDALELGDRGGLLHRRVALCLAHAVRPRRPGPRPGLRDRDLYDLPRR